MLDCLLDPKGKSAHLMRMDAFEFTRIAAAVIVGNALTFIVAYLVWRANKVEKIGLPASTLPGWLYLLALIPFGVVFFAAASLN